MALWTQQPVSTRPLRLQGYHNLRPLPFLDAPGKLQLLRTAAAGKAAAPAENDDWDDWRRLVLTEVAPDAEQLVRLTLKARVTAKSVDQRRAHVRSMPADDGAASGEGSTMVMPYRQLTLRPVLLRGRRLLQLSLLDARQDITKNYEPSAAAAELARLLPLPWQSAALHTRTRSVTVQTNRRGHVKMQSGPAQLEVQLQDATTQPHSMHEKTKADLQDAPAAGPQQKNTNTQHNHQREQQALQQTALTGSSLAAAAAANVAAHGGGARLISLQHDRAKAQPLDGAVPDPFLQRIGLQTADGRIKADMQVRNCHCH